jgi:MraZ protein
MLPPDFRELLFAGGTQASVMLTNFDGCVVGYPLSEWEEIEKSFSKINVLDKKLRAFQRFFISGAVEVPLDKQGRVLVPPHLRSYAKLGKEVVTAGVGSKFEIWDLSAFEAQRQEMEENFDEDMSALAEKGFELRL